MVQMPYFWINPSFGGLGTAHLLLTFSLDHAIPMAAQKRMWRVSNFCVWFIGWICLYIYILPMKSNEYRIRFSLIVLYRTCLAIPDRRKKIRKGLRLLKGLCSWRTMCLITLCTEFIKIFIIHRSQSNLAALAACSRPSWRHWSMYFKPNINVW